MAGTHIDMVNNIKTELRQAAGAVADSDIKRKIYESIDSYRNQRFLFNEKETTFPTTIGIKDYPLGTLGVPADILHIDSMTVLYGGRPIPVEPVDPEVIQRDYLLNTPSLPTHWSINHGSLLLYPIPNSVYTVDIIYISDFSAYTPTSADNYTDAWFTTGERLIRNATKALIYGELLRNPAEEMRAIQLTGRAFLDLKSRTSSIRADFQVQPWGL